ncbi:MAG: efflux RND transporter periplasmic adaptor subunit [Planctomycetota bacterium]
MTAKVRKIAFQLCVLSITLVLVLWAVGACHGGRVQPGSVALEDAIPAPAATALVVREQAPVLEEIVGTVESRARAAIAAQVSARVVSVTKDAGAMVAAGEVVVHLDDRELSARRAQARQALAAADAALERARQSRIQADARLKQVSAHHQRLLGYLAQGAATPEQMEAAESDLAQAGAALAEAEAMIAAATAGREQAHEAVEEADVALGYTVIVSPVSGVIAQRAVEPGEVAWPGRTLLVVHDPRALRLSAPVREGLIGHVVKGQRWRSTCPRLPRA